MSDSMCLGLDVRGAWDWHLNKPQLEDIMIKLSKIFTSKLAPLLNLVFAQQTTAKTPSLLLLALGPAKQMAWHQSWVVRENLMSFPPS